MNKKNISITQRLENINWDSVIHQLSEFGCVRLNQILFHDECNYLAALYPQSEPFRTHIHMARYNFGKGEYKYFNYPLPAIIAELRTGLYPKLATIANHWNEQLSIGVRYPATHQAYLDICHIANQTRPTPLLLQYLEGDYNCLHQDLYGELVFPLQVVFLLSEPGSDFSGGEFVLTEQRPRMQTRTEVVSLKKGDAAIFAVHHRPVQGTKGIYRVNIRHGISKVRSGQRHALGIIFHDAQ
ncbi:proline hydroxylase [Chania multitudinisentens RB-25]|uniref:Proline hydroxylase n=1 Tax=Chania multitudinisentens RB-25 TaxID=1441930 RepID=W0LFW9_9GAMM|nr:2OG-Fe(II) oxygenase [Chania multitudinisentens]AHG20835.1 proline hydroxylase [Chania multitudinisentens RB-25]